MDIYKIDDVSKECGLTKRTIRYYEEIGLLFPPERSEGGTRLYTRKHIDRLKQISNARDVLGFSLQEIQDFVSVSEELEQHREGYRQAADEDQKRPKLMEIERVLAEQIRMIDYKLEKLAEIRKDINHLHKRVRDAIDKYEEKE